MKGLARRLESPIIMVAGGDDLNDNSYPNRCASGEFNGIGEAMAKLGMASNHPELANVPLVGIGHSHGGDYWNWYNACHPEKMAVVFVHASGGVNYSAGSLRVPVIYELGTGDLIENGSKKPRAGMFVNRAKGAPMALVIGQGEGHNNVTPASLAMVIDIIEVFFKLRVPSDADAARGPVALLPIDETKAWLGNLYTKEIAPYASYMGNKALTSVLPTEELARKWKDTGPGLPMSITLPGDTCGWCGNPKDEPKAGAAPPPSSAPPPVDAGATSPADSGSAPPPSTGNPMPVPPPVSPSGTGGAPGGSAPMGGSDPGKRPDAAPAPTGTPDGASKPAVGGCAVAIAPAPAEARWWLIAVALGLAVLARRRRRG
jgi:MYXO-CTERM domain-containing protein